MRSQLSKPFYVRQMGTIIKAICNCGFKSEDVFAGGGFSNFRTICLAPALCLNCKTFVVKNYLNKYSRCPVCRKKVTFYNNPILQVSTVDLDKESIFSWHTKEKEEFLLPDTLYLCPKCEQIRLKFVWIGNWD